MASTSLLKPFVINIGDIMFLLDQVNFRPLFNSAGQLIFNWDGTTTVYASVADAAAGSPLYVASSSDPTSAAATNAVALYGTSYYSIADAAGTRDVQGVANNLDPNHAYWGAADVPFIAISTNPADLGYVYYGSASSLAGAVEGALMGSGGQTLAQKSTGDYTVSSMATIGSVVDYTPRMITQTISTGGVKFLTYDATFGASNGQLVYFNKAVYDQGVADIGNSVVSPAAKYAQYLIDHNIDAAHVVDGTSVVDTQIHVLGTYNAGLYAYGLLEQALGLTSGTQLFTMSDGSQVILQFSQAAIDQVNLIQSNHLDASTLTDGQQITVGSPADAYGLLATLGVQDQQNPDNGEYFIEASNPGIAPTNGFFAVFGQFFDHGLDFIGKGGNASGATITIPLATTDPLYGVIGPDGMPTTKITISRATVDHVDNGVPQYVNQTSPYIDQSQTYGSNGQITQILREWVVDPNNPGHFIAGARLLDGHETQTYTDGFGNSTTATLPTLNELRAHVQATGRAAITWEDVLNLRERDANGQLLDTDANTAGIQTANSGHALLLDMNPGFGGMVNANTTTAQNITQAALDAVNAATGLTTGQDGFLYFNADGVLATLVHMGPSAMEMTGAGALMMGGYVDNNFNVTAADPTLHAAIGEILMESVGHHYVAGDGRVNENVALTSIHHIFHMEHGYQAQNFAIALEQQDALNTPTDHTTIRDWQVRVTAGASADASVSALISKNGGYWHANSGILARDADGNFHVVANAAAVLPSGWSLVLGRGSTDAAPIYLNAAGNYTDSHGVVSWDQEKMFQATKLVVEMEYQHTAVDQYARAVSPDILEFSSYSPSIDATIDMAYSQGAFRFGHSTLRETIDTMDPTGSITGKIMSYALEKAFLNPDLYAQVGASSIVMGMTHQVMNDVDEFITPALQQGLLGLPMDLAAINIARGRDVGLPTLNQARGLLGLSEYTSWSDFGNGLFHKESLVNFIAAYAFDGDTTHAQAVLDAAAGLTSATWADTATSTAAAAFLNGGNTAFNNIDLWIGGLAEAHIVGGLLGETFNVVFVDQIARLMNGDRFYYLYRLAGQQFGDEIINEQFKDMVERNTGLIHLNGSIFSYSDKYYEMGQNASAADKATQGAEHSYGQTIADYETSHNGAGVGVYTNGGDSTAANGDILNINGKDYVLDLRPNLQPDVLNTDGTATSGADSKEILAGTKYDDLIYLGFDDDTGYGDGGNDIIYGGIGFDRIYGGDGNDLLFGGDQPDVIDGGSGDDIIYGDDSGSSVGGFDQLIGGTGNDTIYGGIGIDKIFGNAGDDALYGGADTDPFMFGGDGNDIVDGGDGQDNLYGNAGDDLIIGGADKDILQGQDGDDILRPGIAMGSMNAGGGNTGNAAFGPDEVIGGMGNINAVDTGFDLIDLSDNVVPFLSEIDLTNQQNPATAIDQNQVLPTFFEIDGIIGTQSNDNIMGDAGGNWLIGGKGSDTFEADTFIRSNGSVGAGAAPPDRTGNDVFVGGSIRLDALIGKYMLGNQVAAYDQSSALEGYSHRVSTSAVLTGGILGGSQTGMFDKHFTNMLKSEQFKDMVLGDNLDDSASVDTVSFTGRLQDYRLTAIDANGNTVVDPHQNWAQVAGVKVEDRGTGQIDDPNNPGTLIARGNTDGTDLLIGIDQMKFSDQTISPAAFFDIAPVVDLNYVPTGVDVTLAQDNFNGILASYSRGSGWTGSWTETGDPVPSGLFNTAQNSGQIQDNGDQLRFTGGTAGGGVNFDGASIYRTISGLQNVTNQVKVAFDYTKAGISGAETVKVYLSTNGSAPTGSSTPLLTIDSTSAGGHFETTVNGPFTSGARLYFVASAMNAASDVVTVDNIVVSHQDTVDNSPGNNNTISYDELGAAQLVSASPLITDADDLTLVSAHIKVRDSVTGDHLVAGSMPAGITATQVNAVEIMLTGTASHADYQAALAAITFSNSTQNPTNYGARNTAHVDVTVNDGLKDSAVATTSVNINAVNDPAVLGNDNVITYVAAGNSSTNNFSIPVWALLANDVDPDTHLAINGASLAGNGVTVSGNGFGLTSGGTNVTVRDTTGSNNSDNGHTFNYGVTTTTSPANTTATVNLTHVTSSTVNGTTGDDVFLGNTSNGAKTFNAGNGNDVLIGSTSNTGDNLNGGAGNDTFQGNAGNDLMNGDAGNDTFIWNASGDGSDVIDGGADTDTFVINGSNTTEYYRIYAVTGNNVVANGLPANLNAALNGNTEIVVTRATSATGTQTIVAQLRNIEELVINGSKIRNGNTNAGSDIIQIIGNFAATSLALNTIHINGSEGDDTVDISQLTSDHRIVFNTGGGNDHVIGDLRSQDIVSGELSANPAASTGGPTVDDDPVNVVTGVRGVFRGQEHSDLIVGGDKGETMIGGAGNDEIHGNGGKDRIDAGDGDDTIFGGAGNDRIYAGAGDDWINAGAGNDKVWGGAGMDRFVAESGDGNDVYYGDASFKFSDANDTLDMSAITAAITVDLGNGSNGKGSAVSADTGHDTLYGIENVVTGSGDDVITASNAVNVIDGGDGHNTFRFLSEKGADGDTIVNFHVGDKIDLSSIDANHVAGGNQAFLLVSGGLSGALGELYVSFATDADGEVTLVEGATIHTDGSADFTLTLRGHHDLGSGDFDL